MNCGDTITYLPALHRQLSLVPKELSRIGPFPQGRKNVQGIDIEHLLISILSRDQSRVRGGCCIRGPTRQPLFDDSAACSGTADLCTGESEGNEDLRGKECGIRSGRAIRWGEEAEGTRVEGGEEGGSREQCVRPERGGDTG